jgi:hypothetical protein
VPGSQPKRKREGRFDLIGYATSGHMEALLVDIGEHWVWAWMSLVEGRPTVVGLEVIPPQSATQAGRAEYFDRFVDTELKSRVSSFPIERLRQVRLPLHAFQLSAFLEARRFFRGQADALDPGGVGDLIVSSKGLGLTPQQTREIDALWDAVTFSEAVARGDHNPAQAVASARQISIRTAHGRVRRARALGFLMEPRAQGVVEGELTTHAADWLSRMRRQSTNGPSRPKDDEFYFLVGVEHSMLVRLGEQHPMDRLAEAYGVKRATVSGWLKEVRKRGLLKSATSTSGRGGELTQKIRDALKGSGDG